MRRAILATVSRSPLVRALGARDDATDVVVALPHAGGGARFFQPWASLLPQQVQLLALQYPGREDRISEPPFKSMDELVGAVLRLIAPLEAFRTYLFGHSMGAQVAYALCQAMEQSGRRPPAGLFVSAAEGPFEAHYSRSIHERDDDDLCAELRDLGGTPSALLASLQTRSLVLSPLRADYSVLESWSPARTAVSVPVTAIYGDSDPSIRPGDVEGWREATSAGLSTYCVPGGHFYLADRPSLAVDVVTDTVLHDGRQSLRGHRNRFPSPRSTTL